MRERARKGRRDATPSAAKPCARVRAHAHGRGGRTSVVHAVVGGEHVGGSVVVAVEGVQALHKAADARINQGNVGGVPAPPQKKTRGKRVRGGRA